MNPLLFQANPVSPPPVSNSHSPFQQQPRQQQPDMSSANHGTVGSSPLRQSRGHVGSPPPPAPAPRSGSPLPRATADDDEEVRRLQQQQHQYGGPLFGASQGQAPQVMQPVNQAPLLSMPIGLPVQQQDGFGFGVGGAQSANTNANVHAGGPAILMIGGGRHGSDMRSSPSRSSQWNHNTLPQPNNSHSPPHSTQSLGATAAPSHHHAMHLQSHLSASLSNPPPAPTHESSSIAQQRSLKSWMPSSKNRRRAPATRTDRTAASSSSTALLTPIPTCNCPPFSLSSSSTLRTSTIRSSQPPSSPAVLPSWKSPDLSSSSSSLRRSDRAQLLRLLLMWIVPMLIFFTSVFMAIYANRQIAWTEEDSLDTVTSFRCDQQLDRLANEIPSRMLDPARFFQAYVQQAQTINQDALNDFFFGSNVSTYLRFHLHPRVLNQDRAQWERANAPLQITVPADPAFVTTPKGTNAMYPPPRSQLNNGMVPRPINASPLYWPVQFASPQRGVSLGFDFYYGPRTMAVDRVLRTGEPVLSDVVYLYMPLEDPETLQPGLVLFTKPVVRTEDNSTWMVSATVNLIPYLTGTLGKSAPSARIYAKVEIGGVPVFESEKLQPGDGIAARAPYVKTAMIGQQNITMVCLPTAFLAGLFITGWSVAAPLLTVFGGAGLAWMIATLVDRLQRLRTAESLLLSWRSYSEAILQATPNPMILVNDEGNIAGVNEPLLELTGHTTDSIRLVTKLCDLIVPLRKDPDEELFNALSVVGGSQAGTGRAADDASLRARATVASHSAGGASRQNQQQRQQQQSQPSPPPPDSTSIQIPSDQDENDSNADTIDLQAVHDLLLTPGRREVLVVPAPALTSNLADLDAASTIDAMVTVSEPTGNPVIQHVLVLTDLREQRARDRQLAELLRETELLNAQQRQLLLYLAHELRNPVYVIQGSVQAAADAAADQVANNGAGPAGVAVGQQQHPSADVSLTATEASDRAGVLAATEHVTTLLDAVVEYVEASSAAMAVFPYTSPGSRGAEIAGRVGGGASGAGGTLVRPSEAIAAATLARSTYGRAASALRAGHASGSSPRMPGPAPPPPPADASLSLPHRMVAAASAPTAAASMAPNLRPTTIGLSDALHLADVISPATALALNPDWTHLDINGHFSSLPVTASNPRTPDAIYRPPCVQLSRASRHALHKLSAVCRAAPGVTLAGWSVALPHPLRFPPQRPGAACPLISDSETYITLCAALALPDSIGHADLTALSSPFDWSISGQGSEFRLFGLQVAILMRLAELAGGMAKVDQANREIVLQIPARQCSWVAQGLPCEGVKAMGEIGLMEVSGLGASSTGQQVKVNTVPQQQKQRSGIVGGEVRARPVTPPSTPAPDAAAGEHDRAGTLPTAISVSTVAGHTSDVGDDVELQPLLLPKLQTCDSAATVIAEHAEPVDSKVAMPEVQVPPKSPVVPTLVSVSVPVSAPDHHECPSEASSAPASPLVVLLVEDNALIQALTKRFLERDGFHVVVADHGQAALDLLADPDLSSRVHLVVMDLMMPVLDGIDATRIIRQTRSPAELPIVALTANAMAEERERCLQSGFNAFLTKPVTRQKLIETVRSLWSASASPVTTTLAPVQA